MATSETHVPVFISIAEAAELASVSRQHIGRLVRRGKIPAVTVGAGSAGPLRVLRAEFLDWLLGDPDELQKNT